MANEQDKKNKLGKWGSGWRVFLLLFIASFFVAGLAQEIAEIKNNSLLGLTGLVFISIALGFGFGAYLVDKDIK